jgi:tRNA threonylcarbamoyladenosine biosynthesis protein TsaE
MKRFWISRTPEDNPGIAGELLQTQNLQKVICFYGAMGAGKTTFIRSLCEQLGVEDQVQSPTFSIVNEYKNGSGEPVYHFDFYRLKNEEEAFDLGYEQYLFSGYFCLIEWPEKISGLLDGIPHSVVTILPEGENRRISLEND